MTIPNGNAPYQEPPVTFRDLLAVAALVAVAGREAPSSGAALRIWKWADAVLAERDVRS
jgi:hypothetical protein